QVDRTAHGIDVEVLRLRPGGHRRDLLVGRGAVLGERVIAGGRDPIAAVDRVDTHLHGRFAHLDAVADRVVGAVYHDDLADLLAGAFDRRRRDRGIDRVVHDGGLDAVRPDPEIDRVDDVPGGRVDHRHALIQRVRRVEGLRDRVDGDAERLRVETVGI